MGLGLCDTTYCKKKHITMQLSKHCSAQQISKTLELKNEAQFSAYLRRRLHRLGTLSNHVHWLLQQRKEM